MEDNTEANRALVPVDRGELLPPVEYVYSKQDPDPAPVVTIETREARRAPSLETDVWVPALQAGCTAAAIGTLAGLLGVAVGWSWRVPVVIFGLALAFGWAWRLRLVDSLLWRIETITGQDLNHDRQKGKPVTTYGLINPRAAQHTIATENQQDQDKTKRDELLAFVDRCCIAGTSEAAHRVKASGPDRAAYVAKRDALLSLGIARWKNPARPKGGWVLACSRQKARETIEKHVL